MTQSHLQHIAIIMDGNGRWAKRQGLPRLRGHEEGVKRTREIVEACREMNISYLTLYAFSAENWNRPPEEVNFLMNLLAISIDKDLRQLKENNVCLRVIGERERLPESLVKKIEKAVEATHANNGLNLTIALSYSSRLEILQATKKIAAEVQGGQLNLDGITPEVFSQHLYTCDLPDPDLLIRTSGEFRISNFLLWQLSYSELYVTEKFWPEFDKQELKRALEVYGKRERRFGLTESAR